MPLNVAIGGSEFLLIVCKLLAADICGVAWTAELELRPQMLGH